MSTAHVTLSGPLFEGKAHEVVAVSAEELVRELTEMGEARLKSAFPTGVPVKSGNYRAHIHSTIQGASAQIDDGGVVYGPWLEGTSSRNQTTRFKGYATFRRAEQWLDAQAKGPAQKRAAKLARDLGGG